MKKLFARTRRSFLNLLNNSHRRALRVESERHAVESSFHTMRARSRQSSCPTQAELLEVRTLLTTTFYLDFGGGIGMGNTLSTTVGDFRNIFGTGISNLGTGSNLSGRSGMTDASSLDFTPLNYDFDGNSLINDDDITALANAVVPIVERALEPFDIDVVVGTASSFADAVTAVGSNNSALDGQNDAYNFIMPVISDAFNDSVNDSMLNDSSLELTGGQVSIGSILSDYLSTLDSADSFWDVVDYVPPENSVADGSVGNFAGLFGIAAASDLFTQNGNRTDEATLTFTDTIYGATSGTPGTAAFNENLAYRIAYTAAHEGFHTFTYIHSTGSTSNQELLSSGDVIRLGSVTREDPFQVVRFDLDRQSGGVAEINGYLLAANDTDIGLVDENDNSIPDFAYVSGTGAHDIITLTSTGATTVNVDVEAYSDAGYTNLIASESYTINLTTETEGEILIDAGINADRIIIDGNIDATYRVRGGTGVDGVASADDEIQVTNGSLTVTPSGPGAGQITIQGTSVVIDYEEVEIVPAASAGEISGRVWDDINANGVQDNGEAGLQGWTVYLDTNGNGLFENFEPNQTTDAQGDYTFTGLAAGNYQVRQVLMTGYEQTSPFIQEQTFRLLGSTGSGTNSFSLIDLELNPVDETVIGAVGFQAGMDVDPTTGILYGASSTLVTIDPDTGARTTIGSIDSSTETGILMRTISFDPSGQLFGTANDILYQIDKTTAVATEIGPTNVNSEIIWSIEFADDGTLYGGFGSLYTISPTTGTVISTVGSFGGVFLADFDIDPDGTLRGLSSSTNPGELYEVSLSDGAVSQVASYASDLNGLASIEPAVINGLPVDVTTTGSTVATAALGVPIEDVEVVQDGFSVQTVQSSSLINLDDFRNDPRFAGIDGSGYSVVILDTGIDSDHPFFGADLDNNGVADRIVASVDFTGSGTGAEDIQGHGSNVASIALSSDGTHTGMAPGANIISLKVLNDFGSGSFAWVESALQWVIANASTFNIVSTNMSLGDGSNRNTPVGLFGIDDELSTLNSMGIINVAAAGNDYFNYQTPGVAAPAADPNTLAVGAVWDGNNGSVNWGSGASDFSTAADRLTSFTQRSDTMVGIFAPGAFITGAAPGGGTSSFGGTSQAAPHIAGIVAIAQQLAQQSLGRLLTPAEFESLIISSGVTINDGDDEDDNVTNTNDDYQRIDVFALGEAILNLSSPSTADPQNGYWEVTLGISGVENIDFGNRMLPEDPDDQISEAVPFSVGSTVSDEIEFTVDVDMYAVTVNSNARLSFDIDTPTAGVDTLLRIYDGSGNLLAENNDGSNAGPAPEFNPEDSLLVYNFGSAGTYYVAVSNRLNDSYDPITGDDDQDGSTGPYELRITESIPIDDFGDAPDTYGTVLTSDGPRHLVGSLFLGAEIDIDLDGNPNTAATGDDITGDTPDDEDGVTFTSALLQGNFATAEVTTNGAGQLSWWIDFDNNGAFDNDEYFTQALAGAGVHEIEYLVPYSAIPGATYARFRFASQASEVNTPLGFAADGEVEDYQVTVAQFTPPLNITVTTTVDENDGTIDPTRGTGVSLREAIIAANANPDFTTIRFHEDLDSNPILLTNSGFPEGQALSGDLDILQDVRILGNGPANTIIDGGGASGLDSNLFQVMSGLEVLFDAITFTGANNSGNGGAIESSDSILTVTNSIFEGNSSTNGAGISAGGFTSILTVENSTFIGNSALFSGGAISTSVGATYIFNSTFTQNETRFSNTSGGVIDLFPFSDGITQIVNSTISDNNTSGIDLFGGEEVLINNTIVSGSNGVDLSGSFLGTNNIIEDGQNILGLTNTIVADPLLGPLQNNGGPTPTFAIDATSPAFNNGDNDAAVDEFGTPLQLDQRGPGFTRINGGTVDIGAYEFGEAIPPTLLSFVRQNPAGQVTTANSLTLRVSFDEIVVNVDAFDFLIQGTTTATITNVIPVTGSVYDVTISGGNLDTMMGFIGLDLRASHNITDVFQNRLPNSQPAIDETYFVANVPTQLTVSLGHDELDDNFSVNDLSLREAIYAANALPDSNQILFSNNLNFAPITLSLTGDGEDLGLTGDLDILSTITIIGNDPEFTRLDASALGDRAFHLTSAGALELQNLSIEGASTTGNGGVLLAEGDFVINDTVLQGNHADQGGAIAVTSSALGIISNSTLSGNTSVNSGGAILNEGDLTLIQATVSGNSTGSNGGAIDNVNSAALLVTNSTFYENSITAGLGLQIHNEAGSTAELNNSIFAGLPGSQLSGTFTGSHNLVDDGSGTGLINTVVADPLLQPLNDFGGPTPTHSPTRNSPVINAANAALAVNFFGAPLQVDQRGAGFVRQLGSGVDIGSFEFGELVPPRLLEISRFNPTQPYVQGTSVTFLVRFSEEVINVDATDFLVTDSTATVTNVASSDGISYELTVSGGNLATFIGEIGLDVNPAQDIEDTFENVFVTAEPPLDQVYFIGNIPSIIQVDFTYDEFDNNFNLGDISLREAVYLANRDPDLNTIQLDAGIYDLTLSGFAENEARAGDLDITTPTIIQTTNPGDVATINGQGMQERLFHVQSTGDLTLYNLTLTGGDATGTIPNYNGGALAIETGGMATIYGSTLTDNQADSTGGAIYNKGTLFMANSTISGNQTLVGAGGGIYNRNGGVITLVNSTIAFNDSAVNAAGIHSHGQVTINNSIVSDNPGLELFGQYTGSHNLIEDGSGNGLLNTIVGSSMLEPLADNGGPVFTHQLREGSIGINAGDNSLAVDHNNVQLPFDQRGPGFVRIVDSTVDVGAVETVPAFDYGDAPASYGTLSADNGPVHAIVAGLYLGSDVDRNADGIPSALADGDDWESANDEDGVVFLGPLSVAETGFAEVTTSDAGTLTWWIDFDQNGQFDPAEFFTEDIAAAGTHAISFEIPQSAQSGNSYARFRFSTNAAQISTPLGPADDGEVEDYLINILAENVAPVFVESSAANIVAAERRAPVPVFPNDVITDPNGPQDIGGGSFQVSILSGFEAGDELQLETTQSGFSLGAINGNEQEILSNNNVVGQLVIDQLTSGQFEVLLAPTTDANLATTLLQSVLYQHTGETPLQLLKTVGYSVTDGRGLTAARSVPVNVEVLPTADEVSLEPFFPFSFLFSTSSFTQSVTMPSSFEESVEPLESTVNLVDTIVEPTTEEETASGVEPYFPVSFVVEDETEESSTSNEDLASLIDVGVAEESEWVSESSSVVMSFSSSPESDQTVPQTEQFAELDLDQVLGL